MSKLSVEARTPSKTGTVTHFPRGAGRANWLLSLFLLSAWAADVKAPPKTRTDNVREVIHGVEIVDPYRWLEEQSSPETRAWLEAQNAYARPILDSLPNRAALKQRLTELMRVEEIGMPQVRAGRYFFGKRLPQQELWVIYMRRRLNGEDEALIDPHPLSPDHTTSVNLRNVSRDGRLIAYAVRQGGEMEHEVRFLEVDTRRELPDRLPKARYMGLQIAADNSGFYYVRLGKEGPRLYHRAMGADPARDAEVFGGGLGRDKILSASLSEDGRYLLIHVSHGAGGDAKTDVYFQDLARRGPITPIVNDIEAKFWGSIGGDRLFLQTNWQAPNWRILSVDLRNPARANWREVVPASGGVIQYFTLAGGRLCVSDLENVVSRVRVFEPDGKHVRDIAFPALGSVSTPFGRWESDEAFYAFQSYHIPWTSYRYAVSSGKQEVWARPKIPVDSEKLELKQVWYRSKDGTRVPMFVLHKKGLRLDGARPVLLTGYGGFGMSNTPYFDAEAVLWAERGGVYAVANLRGGGEFGQAWHRAGVLDKKQNSFDDFIAAAGWLVENRYTAPSRLAITGGSNGGLLVGAALTQRPDLFGAVACHVPLLDMIRYHKLHVAAWWISEYGSPDDPAQFKFLYAYSPYHRVKPGAKYPATLIVSGDADTQVDPMHARKMTARLQAATASGKPVLLHYHTKAGHGGAQPLGKRIEDSTDALGFLWWQVSSGQ